VVTLSGCRGSQKSNLTTARNRSWQRVREVELANS